MGRFNKALAAAAFFACALALPAAQAGDSSKEDLDKFVTMCDTDKDGMVSKAEMMKVMEKLFDKHDTKKEGKLDKQQVEAFLKELVKSGS
jgi:Ca2+-binding EF-hand superfamily protein